MTITYCDNYQTVLSKIIIQTQYGTSSFQTCIGLPHHMFSLLNLKRKSFLVRLKPYQENKNCCGVFIIQPNGTLSNLEKGGGVESQLLA